MVPTRSTSLRPRYNPPGPLPPPPPSPNFIREIGTHNSVTSTVGGNPWSGDQPHLVNLIDSSVSVRSNLPMDPKQVFLANQLSSFLKSNIMDKSAPNFPIVSKTMVQSTQCAPPTPSMSSYIPGDFPEMPNSSTPKAWTSLFKNTPCNAGF